MKKYFLILSAAVLAFAFTACDKKKQETKDVTFNIEVSDIAYNAATVKVTPSDTNVYYYYDILKAAQIAEFASDEELVNDYLALFDETIQYYAQYGMNYTYMDFLSKGVDDYEYSGLTPDTVYYVFAFQLDTATFKLVGKVQKVTFNTPAKPAVPKTSLSFSVSYNDSAAVFTPSDNSISYIEAWIDVDTLATYYNNDCEAYYTDWVNYLEQALAYYYSATLSDYAAPGPLYILYEDLEAGHNYIFMAKAYTEEEFNSDLTQVSFSIPAAQSVPAKRLMKGQRSRDLDLKKAKSVKIASLNAIRK